MTSIRRKILFYSFAFIFFVSTPLVILYASGYKISFKNPSGFRLIQKTGMIFLKTEPDQAEIYINGKPKKPLIKNIFSGNKGLTKTPAKIKGLLPGKYKIKLSLDGYWPWEKNVEVEPGQITHLNDIKLFKKDTPLLMAGSQIQEIKPSPDNKKIYLPKNGKIVGLKSSNVYEIAESDQEDIIRWSPDSRKLITGGLIYDLRDPGGEIDLERVLGRGVENIRWPENNSKQIIYLHNSSLNSFDLSSQESKTLIKGEDFIDFMMKDAYLFYASLGRNSTNIKMYSFQDERILKNIGLPYSQEYRFKKAENGLISLYDKNYRILFLIDPMSLMSPVKEIVNGLKYYDWMNNEKLLYANDFEIWLLNMDKREKKLITRISSPITGIISTSDEKYIIYSTERAIKVIELGENDKMSTTELVKMEKVSSPVLSNDGRRVFFMGKAGKQSGLYELEIK